MTAPDSHRRPDFEPPADRVLVLDFGSQVSHLICRRVREAHVYCELKTCLCDLEAVNDFKPKAVILSGGPHSVYEEDSPHAPAGFWEWARAHPEVPLLGICYGMQEMVHANGGLVAAGEKREYGFAQLEKACACPLLDNVENRQVWMSHGDKVTELGDLFEVSARSMNSEFAACSAKQSSGLRWFGLQYHPEVTHSIDGARMLTNFVCGVAGLSGESWTMETFMQRELDALKVEVGDDLHVIGAVSGGVDSSVAASMAFQALGTRFHPFLVDTGLLRKDEAREVKQRLETHIPGMKLTVLDKSEEFYAALQGVTDPEKKRKLIGAEFIKAFREGVESVSSALADGLDINDCYLLQGTLYPDVIESTAFKGPSTVIKSHHNVGGLPKDLPFRGLVEPLRWLFKDEVRSLGVKLGLPAASVYRHPFPGPGLGIRIVGGEVNLRNVRLLQEADAIFLEEIRGAGLYDDISQALCVLLPETKSVGVMGDFRTYEATLAIRCVKTTDFMTADFYHLPYDLLARISSRIVNEVRGINRVTYDVTSKPPGTIEWE